MANGSRSLVLDEGLGRLKTLDAAQTRAALPYGALIAALLDMFGQQQRHEAQAPPRAGTSLPGGALLLMPASNQRFASLKVVTVHAANAELGLPVVQSDMLLMDAATGTRLLRVDGNTLTNRRTAALSLAGAQRAGCLGAKNVLLIGAGAQARAHAEALVEIWGVRHFWIHTRKPSSAEGLIAELRAQGIDASYCTDPAQVAPLADLVVSATTSLVPVVPEKLHHEATVIAVGAFRPDMAEVPASVVLRAEVYVDCLEGAQAEAGDLIQANIDWRQVQVFASARPAVRDGRPLLIKTVGHALWDLAAATVAHAQTLGIRHAPVDIVSRPEVGIS